MSDRAYHATTLSQAGFATIFRDNTEANFGESRLKTVVRHTTGPNTLTPTVDIVLADLTAGAFTDHLPAAPADGDEYEFGKIDASGNALTIGRNGKTINGAAADVTISTQWAGKRLTWSAVADTWWSR